MTEKHVVQWCDFDNDLEDEANWQGSYPHGSLSDAIDKVCEYCAINFGGVMIWVDYDNSCLYRIRSDKVTSTFHRW